MPGGCKDTHKPPAEHCYVGVLPGEREGRLYMTEICWEEGSDCGLGLVPGLLLLGGVLERILPRDSTVQ